MKYATIQYSSTFGKCDSSDWIDYKIALTDVETVAYDQAIAEGRSLNDVPELQDVLQRAYDEINEMEIEIGIDTEVEYVMECQGLAPMDEDELNELVATHDSHALAFFGLTEATDEVLEEWDAYDLDKIPCIKDFKEDFEPYSPYDEGWSLNIQFVDSAK